MFLRLFAVLALLVGAIAVTPAAAQVSQSSATANLNIRQGPGTQFAVIGQVPRGQWVQVFGCTNPISWCQIRFGGLQGWVSASFLNPRPNVVMPVPLPTPVPQPIPLPTPQPWPIPPGPGPGPWPTPWPGPAPWPGPQPFPPFPGPPQPGVVTVVGTLTSEGVECPTLRANDGRLYSLAGNTGLFRPGNRVRVSGRIAQMSFCMQGTTIQVQSIQPAF